MKKLKELLNWTGILLIGSMISVVSGQQDSKPAEKPSLPQPDKKVLYKTLGDIELRMHIFMPPGTAGDIKETPNHAAALFFFGGGFVSGTPSQFYPHCAYLASRGMVAVAAEYRIKNLHKTTPVESIKDARSAVRWIRVHADELGVDPNRLAVGGGSAGGFLAAAAATINTGDEAGDDLAISCHPNALLLFNPVLDGSYLPRAWLPPDANWQDYSPLHNITPDMAPAAVFLGTQDKLISIQTAHNFKAALQDAKSRCDLHLYEGQGHGFFNLDRNTVYYYLTLQEADRFLSSLGYLKGEPTLIVPPQFAAELAKVKKGD